MLLVVVQDFQTKDLVAFNKYVLLLYGSKEELSLQSMQVQPVTKTLCHKDFVTQTQHSIDHRELHIPKTILKNHLQAGPTRELS